MPEQPYPGLRTFEPDEWSIFFGRETMAQTIMALLADKRLVVIHGASGCGKSSVVRAGVLPALRIDHMATGRFWKTAVMRPSGGPLLNLAEALASALGPPTGASTASSPVQAWLRLVADGPSLLDRISDSLASLSDGAPTEDGGRRRAPSFCLLIDQFEEIFTWSREHGPEEAQQLVEILCRLADQGVADKPNIFVIATMRSDFLGYCARFAGFAEVTNRCQYLLPKMDDVSLLRAIHRPAELYDGKIDDDVGDKLLFVARDETDGLPIVQHVLMRATLIARQRSPKSWVVTMSDIARVGDTTGALSMHGDEIYNEATKGSPQREAAIEWMFRSLCGLDIEGEAVRRPCELRELAAVSGTDEAEATALIAMFCAPGRNLLTVNPPGMPTERSVIDVTHEALLRSWKRLSDSATDPESGERRGWIYREFEAGLVWRAMAVQAKAFVQRGEAALDPATAEVRLPFFEQIKLRPAWIGRYLIDRVKTTDPTNEPEWKNVCALMDESRKRMELARDEIIRLRKTSVWTLGALAAAIAVIVVAGGFALVISTRQQLDIDRKQHVIDNIASAQAILKSRVEAADLRKRNKVLADVGLRETQWVDLTNRAYRGCLSQGGSAAMHVQCMQEVFGQAQAGAPAALKADTVHVYFHVPDKKKMECVKELKSRFLQAKIDAMPVRIEGVAQGGNPPPRWQLRCFSPSDCTRAPKILAVLSPFIESAASPPIDLSNQYQTLQSIAPNYFEVWFPEGFVPLKNATTPHCGA